MGRHVIETIMGAVVLVVAAGFLAFAYQQGAVRDIKGYDIKASFSDISGIAVGSDVRIGGMKVGVVSALDLDPKTYQAIAVMQIQDGIRVPKDSSAAVASSGLLGDKFIKLDPGGDDQNLEAGDLIRYTQSAVNLEDMIGKFMFSGGGVESGDEAASKKAPKAEDKTDGDAGEDEKKSNPFSLGF